MDILVEGSPNADPPAVESLAKAVKVAVDDRDQQFDFPDLGLRLVLSGRLYGGSQASVARTFAVEYRRRGPEAIQALNGSFAGALVDSLVGEVICFTDRFATRKLYVSSARQGARASTQLAMHSLDRFALSAAGVSSYLTCDGVHGGLTPFDGIEMVPSASFCRLGSGRIRADAYLDWTLDPRDGPYDSKSLMEEMIELMRSSVRDRVAGARGVFLSLSAGYDSRGLLGFLTELIHPEQIRTFTYHRGEVVGDMDRDLAAELARIAGVSHRVLDAYGGDFMALLEYNGLRGQAVAHFCEEGDVWRGLEPEFANAEGWVLAVGERQAPIGWDGAFLEPEAALAVSSVWPTEAIIWFLQRLEPSVAEALRSGWSSRYDEVVDRVRAGARPEAVLPRAYFHERIGVTLALWRQLFCGNSIQVVSPFLDGRLMDFVATLPLALNDAQKAMLHRAAISSAFPHLASVPISRGGWNIPDWYEEVRRQREAIELHIRATDSPLDDLISPEQILRLLAEVAGEKAPIADMTSGLAWRVRKAVRSSVFVREVVRKRRRLLRTRVRPIDKGRMLRRVLCLRQGLRSLLMNGVD